MERDADKFDRAITAMNRVRILSDRQKYIIENEGWIAFIKAILSTCKNRLLFYRTYYLSLQSPKDAIPAKTPEITNLTLNIVSTAGELDRLVTEGFDFQPWYSTCKTRLNKGAIGLLVFAGNELANMFWLAITPEGQQSLDGPPVKVDFANNEAFVGGLWTKPEYRGMGIAPYANYKRLEYLRERGVSLSRGSIRMNNIAGLRLRTKQDSKTYATGRHIKILWWESWKEIPIRET